MSHRLDSKELIVLHRILEHIPDFEPFNPEVIYKSLNRGEGVDSGIFMAITDVLIDRKFAIGNSSTNNRVLLLKEKGRMLKAFGSTFAMERITFTDDEARITANKIIPELSPYGEFFRIYNPGAALSSDQNRYLIDKYIGQQLEDAGINYLINNGFAINRHDIEDGDKTYRQLTEKGRNLKTAGSLEAYEKSVIELDRQLRLKSRRDVAVEYFVIISGAGTALTAVFSFLSLPKQDWTVPSFGLIFSLSLIVVLILLAVQMIRIIKKN